MIIKNEQYYKEENGSLRLATATEIANHLKMKGQKHDCKFWDLNPGGYCNVCGGGRDHS